MHRSYEISITFQIIGLVTGFGLVCMVGDNVKCWVGLQSSRKLAPNFVFSSGEGDAQHHCEFGLCAKLFR